MANGIATKQITIAGDRFTLNTLTATQGLKVFGKLSSMIGFGLQNAFDGNALAGAILSKMDDPDLAANIKALLSGLRKNDVMVEFETEFAANYGVLSQLVIWAVKENFGSFLADNPALSAIFSKAKANLATPPATPTSTVDSSAS